MNESRIIFRQCAVCGKEIEVKLSSKSHWWDKRKILEGGYFFFSNLKSPSLRSKWSWHTKFLPFSQDEEIKKYIPAFHRVMNQVFWWWSFPMEESSVPNWKKPYYLFRGWVEEKLDPSESSEYWECPECFAKSGEEVKKE